MHPIPTSLIAFIIAAGLVTISPGLDSALVLRTAASEGPRPAALTGLGIAIGCLVWATVVAAGLGALLEASRLAYTVLRWAGAAYLIYLGVTGLRDPPFRVGNSEAVTRAPAWRSYLQGVVVEGTNPKTVTFFLALVPQLIATFKAPSVLALAAFCLIVPLTALPIDVTVGITGGTLAAKVSGRPAVSRGLNLCSCLILMGLGVLVLFT
jgi:threonine/homoserine/homoserine lactone efflux protein